MKDGFLKVAAAAPMLRVADPMYNAEQIIEVMKKADKEGVKVLVFPELSLTGATCGDLFYQNTLLRGALAALEQVADASTGMDMLIFVGLPVENGAKVYDCAAAISDGSVLGLVPAENVSDKHFTAGCDCVTELYLFDEPVLFGSKLLFDSNVMPDLKVAAQIGADADAPVAPAAAHALAGATVIAQLSGFQMSMYSAGVMPASIKEQSRRLMAGYVMAAPGFGESSTDATYSGLCAVTELGRILACKEDGCTYVSTELDIELMVAARRKAKNFEGCACEYTELGWGEELADTTLTRPFGKYPYRPADEKDYHAAAKRLLHMQASALVRRMQYAGLKHSVVGISGGVDSTLAVIICAEAAKMMGLPKDTVTAVTMPCFGTTDRTKSNAIIVSEQLGATVRVIDIGESVMQHFKDIDHDPENRNVVYENAQARERTQILMDIANGFADGGIHVGTEDMSEFADGWCTYNGDHISMYDVNAGSTKTMVQMVVRYVAETTDDKVLADALFDVLDTPVSPELLPPTRNGEIAQKSEESVGPYNLQDFFLYYLVEQGFTPGKVLRLADIAYGDEFDHETLKKWLRSYCKRLFSQQFKRSCLQDGPTLVNFSLSPRTGFLMPSDGSPDLYFATVDALE